MNVAVGREHQVDVPEHWQFFERHTDDLWCERIHGTRSAYRSATGQLGLRSGRRRVESIRRFEPFGAVVVPVPQYVLRTCAVGHSDMKADRTPNHNFM